MIKMVVVHDGVYHTDDVVAVALMKMLNPDIFVLRLSEAELPPESDEVVIADIGGGKFDHHQEGAALRKDGRKHAACGLILKEFGNQIYPAGVPDELKEFIKDIEDVDNGVFGSNSCVISKYVNLTRPLWDEDNTPAEFTKRFKEVVDIIVDKFLMPYRESCLMPFANLCFFMDEIDRLSKAFDKSIERAEKIVSEAFKNSNGKVVVLPAYLPWKNYLVDTSALFVVYKSARGGINLQCVPQKTYGFENKIDLPEKWLKNKPKGCLFVHPTRFLAAFDSIGHALKAANQLTKAA